MKRIVLLVLLAICQTGSILGSISGMVKATVRVIDESGLPMEGMAVGITFSRFLEIEKAETYSGVTDSRGEAVFEKRAYDQIHASLLQDGYYFCNVKTRAFDEDRKNKRAIYGERTLVLVGKKIRNPIVMVADGDFRATLPGPNIKVGHDFLKNDWAAPHGKGEHADAYFTITGTFESFENHDSLLAIEFPNEGDGLVPFEFRALEGSLLKSAHEAPLDGYVREKRTRKFSSSVVVDPDRPTDVRYETVNEVGDNLGYYFRIRTVMDENGNVASAYYGKIYGDFDFYGAHPDGSYVSARSYYLNPNANDRNVEAVPGETLLPNLGVLDKPNLP